jgi:hypothetical protein
MENTVSLYDITDTNDPALVLSEVRAIIRDSYPGLIFKPVESAFNDVLSLYCGGYPGYRSCNTGYHDLRHTMDVFLALARLVHGARLDGLDLGARNVTTALVSALLHDVGYIQSEDDLSGTGGKFTKTHVLRSVDFMKGYFSEKGYSAHDTANAAHFILCTNKDIVFSSVPFSSIETAILGRMVFASDLMGQMADRIYLEKLPLLFREFVEGEITDFSNEIDLLGKSVYFVKTMQNKILSELDSVSRFFESHFAARFGIERDLYSESIRANLDYLLKIMSEIRYGFRHRLQRSTSPVPCA